LVGGGENGGREGSGERGGVYPTWGGWGLVGGRREGGGATVGCGKQPCVGVKKGVNQVQGDSGVFPAKRKRG